MPDFDPDHLKLTDFMDIATLQEVQDSFAAVANVKATITDAHGQTLTQPAPTPEFMSRQRAIAHAAQEYGDSASNGGQFSAPIMVNNQRLGTITVAPQDGEMNHAAIQFLHLLANAIAQLCFQEFQLRQRINELTAVYNVTMMLSDARNLERVLRRTVEVVCDVMETHAASLRLIDEERDELVIKAVHRLSREYINKGPVRFSSSAIDKTALSSKGYEFVKNLSEDPRTHYPEEAKREGIVSMLSVGMRYKGKAIGVLRVYTNQEQQFSPIQIDLLKAIAAQAAAAIENARLLEETMSAQALERQVQLAVQVQQRMIPSKPPTIPGVDLASVYVPCFELGGDFYDFIELPDSNVGLAVADVSGKGVPASLTMSAVRAGLRAEVDNIYYLYEIMHRLNLMVCRDSSIGEFVTLFYGVLDVRNRRFTYCNAGHPPGLVLRDRKIIELASDNMVLGVNPEERYTQSVIQFQPNDTLLLYTDGLPDAMNFEQKTFGRKRVLDAFLNAGPTAETVAQGILWQMRKFTGLSKRNDDVTMIVAKMK